ncbi:UNVERIFIED_CONTAM: hypothetical protein ABIE34_001716 [Jeotgalibacillus campisalis]
MVQKALDQLEARLEQEKAKALKTGPDFAEKLAARRAAQTSGTPSAVEKLRQEQAEAKAAEERRRRDQPGPGTGPEQGPAGRACRQACLFHRGPCTHDPQG